MSPEPDLEDRVAHLERLLARLVAYARTTAFGRAILARLEIS